MRRSKPISKHVVSKPPFRREKPSTHVPVKLKNELQGRLSLNPNGFGFVVIPNEQDLFIPAKYIENAIDGDTVRVAVIAQKDLPERFAGKGRTGRILGIISRERKTVIGQLVDKHTVLALSKKIPQYIRVTQGAKRAQIGDWVEVLLHASESRSLSGKIERSLGAVGNMSADLDAVVEEYHLQAPYTAAQERQATLIEPLEVEREDATHLFCVSIDPTDAKDHDDAMSFEIGKEKGTVILGVHIADVACYVASGTKWDFEAKKRAFTAYLPGRTLPMLPKSLTETMSLIPLKTAYAHSLFFTINEKNAEILEVRRCHTRLKITHSMTYDQVQRFIDEKVPEKNWDAITCLYMEKMLELTRKMRHNRALDERFLNMAIPEIRVIIDEEKQLVQTVEVREQRESEMMVEECMLMANTAIAQLLHKQKVATIYRVHDEPTVEKLEFFAQTMHESYAIDVGDLSTREGCNVFLKGLKKDEHLASILQQFLRAMTRAEYRVEKSPHFGLGKEDYLHFTSPIRRYTDLLVHRQLLAIDKVEKMRSSTSMRELAEYCTTMEQEIDEASNAANDRMKLHYLYQQLMTHGTTEYLGVCTRLNQAGCSVDIPVLGLFGFIEKDDLYVKVIQGKKGVLKPLNLRIGEKLKVVLTRIDFLKGTAYFIPQSI